MAMLKSPLTYPTVNSGELPTITIEDNFFLGLVFAIQKFDIVVNLAAQDGVRYSITNRSA